MSNYIDQYQQGKYQEIYDELLALGERVFDPDPHDDALAVAREIMRRVRYNLEHVLIPRLETVGYHFRDGFLKYPDDLSLTQRAEALKRYPIFLPPSQQTPHLLEELENLVGALPLSIRCWYEEVGAINLVGAFPESCIKYRSPALQRYKKGYPLDPLWIYPLEEVVELAKLLLEGLAAEGLLEEEGENSLGIELSLDRSLKYDISGSGAYELIVPCRAFDGLVDLDGESITFVDYLRNSFQKAGFLGMGEYISIHDEILTFLLKDLHPF